jgi:type IV conjugative transfer system protein TraL
MEIKKTLDNTPRLIFWPVDEAMMLIIPFMLGVLFGSLLIVLGSFIYAFSYRKFRKKNKEHNFKALSYWLFGVGFQKIPSYIRRFRR